MIRYNESDIDKNNLEESDLSVEKFNYVGNLQDGIANFEVVVSKVYTSKNGRDSVKIGLILTQEEGRKGRWERYLPNPMTLHNKNTFFWSRFLKSIGYTGAKDFFDYYKSGFDPAIFLKETGLTKIVIGEKEYDGKTYDEIRIEDQPALEIKHDLSTKEPFDDDSLDDIVF